MKELKKLVYENYVNRLHINSYITKMAFEIAEKNNAEFIEIRENSNDYIIMHFEEKKWKYLFVEIEIKKGLLVVKEQPDYDEETKALSNTAIEILKREEMKELKKLVFKKYVNRLYINSYITEMAFEIAEKNNVEFIKISRIYEREIVMAFQEREKPHYEYVPIDIKKGLLVVDMKNYVGIGKALRKTTIEILERD